MSKLLDNYITRDQAAQELGVTARTLLRWQKQPDGLPHILIGGRVFYKRASIVAWLESRERRPNQRRAV